MSARRSVPAHLREISRYRELIVMLTRKELTVRYQHSVLGLHVVDDPAAVPARRLHGGLRHPRRRLRPLRDLGAVRPARVDAGEHGLLTATQSITSNASLVGKVKFPRAVLPLSSVGAAFVHFCLQSIAFAVILLVTTPLGRLELHVAAPVRRRHVPHRVRRARPAARPAQRLRPRHDAPARAARARLVLGDSDPVPVRAGRDLVLQPRARRVGAARQPGHTDRDHVPAGDLRDGGRPTPAGRAARCRCCPTRARSGTSACSPSPRVVWGGLLALALRAFDRADVHLAETL